MTATNAIPYVSIIIPVHNQTALLKKLLRSVWAEDVPAGSFEVIITDDGSATPVAPDLTDAEFPSSRAKMAVIRHDRARGAAAARNTAAAAATGEVLLFLDADTIIETGTLKRVYERFRAESALGAVNGGGAQDPANTEDGFTPRYRALLDHIQQNLRAPAACTFFTPRLGAIRRKFFEACGRFDPSFPGASVEEYEFGHRLSAHTPIAFDPNLNVRHHYQKFGKNNRNFFNRVRLWMPIFWKRREFENFGSVTSYYGFGSVFGALAFPFLGMSLMGCPYSPWLFAATFGAFFACYAELFWWNLRLKGPLFFVQCVILSWWLCLFITAGAIVGTLDVMLGKKES